MRWLLIKRADLEEAIYDYEGSANMADKVASNHHFAGEEAEEEAMLHEASLHRSVVYRLRNLHPRSARRYRDGLIRDFKRAVASEREGPE